MKTAMEEQACLLEGCVSYFADTDNMIWNKGKKYLPVKRILDVAVSAVGLAVCAIPMLLIALLIRLDSRGPAIYAQERLGLNGKPFIMYKFRTMYLDAEAGGPQWAAVHDVRRTRVGIILRKTRLDELPQFINILKGEMSLVGPRPERAYFYDIFDETVPGFRKRMMVTPGVTGLAQVNGGYELSPSEKLVYDLEYIRNQSLLLDLKCILMTVRVVFTHKGAR
jgi:lipopolysaccharide/colanic/teichoic acid biosynthesis glycosyltransferase